MYDKDFFVLSKTNEIKEIFCSQKIFCISMSKKQNSKFPSYCVSVWNVSSICFREREFNGFIIDTGQGYQIRRLHRITLLCPITWPNLNLNGWEGAANHLYPHKKIPLKLSAFPQKLHPFLFMDAFNLNNGISLHRFDYSTHFLPGAIIIKYR